MRNTARNEQLRDVIIIGAGPAGSAAAMVLARMRRDVLLIDDGQPRNQRSHGMHNYLSRDGMKPLDFLEIAHRELDAYKVMHLKTKAISATKNEDGTFTIIDINNNHYRSKRLLLATGVTDMVPDIPGMQELWGHGVYHCPYCDGFELCDQNIGLYARRFNGFGMALSMRHLSGKLTLFTDGAGHLRKYQTEILEKEGVRIVTEKLQELYCTDDKLTCVILKSGERIACDAVFVHHGHKVNNDLLLQLKARCTSTGAAITNRKQACSVPGLYVAGDSAIDIHFVAVAAAEGTKAAVAIHDDLMKIENEALILKNI